MPPAAVPPAAPTLEVTPTGGTIAVFPSCVVPHEVRPSTRARYAVTLWFVSPSLLRGSPQERADVASAVSRDAARRVRQKRQEAGQSAGPNASAVKGLVVATATSALAAAWSESAGEDGAGSSGGGGFSFGF